MANLRFEGVIDGDDTSSRDLANIAYRASRPPDIKVVSRVTMRVGRKSYEGEPPKARTRAGVVLYPCASRPGCARESSRLADATDRRRSWAMAQGARGDWGKARGAHSG
jgi:hypothetical protein